MSHNQKQFVPLSIAVLTISDTRTQENDTSGAYLKQSLQDAGHQLADYAICIDNCYQIRAQLSAWIASSNVQVILTTGGTGFRNRDSTISAVQPLLDQTIPGLGELFRHISFVEIGTSTIQSQVLGGIANHTLVFCLPGSTGACRTGWEGILHQQLDATHAPCNFAEILSPATSHD